MSSSSRRDFLRAYDAVTGAGISSNLFPPTIRKALAIPAPDAPGLVDRTVWYQPSADGAQVIAPFRLDTEVSFELMRVQGTPHSWPDSQGAWGQGVIAEHLRLAPCRCR